jgi:hypothetical protein
MIETYGLIAAICSAVATVAAAVAAFRAPLAAAKLAEQLRLGNERTKAEQDAKWHLFTTLMQERARIDSQAAVSSFNLIDVVFGNSPAVRDAWAQLLAGLTPPNSVPPHATQERLQVLLSAMAADLGMATGLRVDDLSRVYLPNSLAQARFFEDMQRQRTLAAVATQRPDVNATSPWPPAPGQ